MGVERHSDETRAKMSAAWVRRRSRLPTFWDRVDASGDCWEWTAGIGTSGYGQHTVMGRHWSAHRYAWELLVGPIPSGLTIDHLCRNRRCVNPDHLEPVDVGVNTLRGHSPQALNARRVVCQNGHPFTTENTRRRPDGHRACRACESAYEKARRAAKRSVA